MDLTDIGHTATVTSTGTSGVTTGLALDQAGLEALINVDLVSKLSGSSGGQVDLTFSATSTDFDYLAAGEQATLTYSILIDDGDGNPATQGQDAETFTVVITGTNDAPVIDSIAQTDIDETLDASAITSPITVTFTDVDLTDIGHTATVTSTGTSGVTTGLALDQAGLEALINVDLVSKLSGSSGGQVDLTFSATSTDFDYLAAGEQATLTYSILIDDGDGNPATQGQDAETFTVVITGTNDAPVIDSIAQTDIDETLDASAITSPITVTFTDVDLTDIGHTATVTSTGTSGVTTGLALDQAGLEALINVDLVSKLSGSSGGQVDLTFSATSTDFDYLAAGEQATLTYSILIDDGDGNPATQGQDAETFTVVITGTNDAPVIDSIAQTDIDETLDASAITSPITVTFTDVDLTDIGHTATVTSTGTSGVTTGLALDQAGLEALINVDLVSKLSGSSGGQVDLTFSATSTDFDYLAAGEQATLTYSILIDDGDGNPATQGQDAETFTVVITGTNDTPTISVETGDSTGDTLDETDAGLTTNGTLTTNDVDLSDTVTAQVVSVTPSGDTTGIGPDNATLLGMLTLTAGPINADAGNVNNLAWTFDSSEEAFNYLADGESLTLTYLVQVTDDSGTGNDTSVTQSVSIVITGTNDAPVISVEDPAAQLEGDTGTPTPQTLTLASLLTASDADAGETPAINNASVQIIAASDSATSDVALLTDNLDGTISYDLADFDFLGASETATFEISFDVVSGSDTETQTVTLTINGENDDPVAVTDTSLTDENSPLIMDLLANDSDVDASDTLMVIQINGVGIAVGETVTLTSGAAVTLNADGTVTYNPLDAFANDLDAGDSDTDTFDYTIGDGNGGTATATATVTIVGDDQFDFIIDSFGGFSGNSSAKVLTQFEQADATVQLEITALGPNGNSGSLPTVNSNADSLGVSSGLAGGRVISADATTPEGLLFNFVSVSNDDLNDKTAMRASSFSLQVFTAGTATLLITLADVVDSNGVSASPSTSDFVLASGSTATVIATGNPNEFIITGLDGGESFTIDTTVTGGSDTTFNEISVENGALELNTLTTSDLTDTYGGNSFTLGLLGVDFPQYVGGSAGDDAGLTGTNLDDTIVGFDGNDILMGLGGDDLLIGGAGNDTLIGGPGADVLRGGADNDTFVLDPTAFTDADAIEDYLFVSGGEEDIVDLTQLFDVATSGQAGDELGDFVRYDNTSGSLSVDADGSTGGVNFVEVAVVYQDIDSNILAPSVTILYDDGASQLTDTAPVA